MSIPCRRSRLSAVVVLSLAAFVLHTPPLAGQGQTYTLPQILGYPFPSEMVASPTGSQIAWAFFERGVRNLYVADGPDYRARRLTDSRADDGQELTNVSFSRDGKFIVYVRGGDHGSNWPAAGNLMPDPDGNPQQPQMQIFVVSISGGQPKLLAEGDEPTISPQGDRVAFIRNNQIWSVPLDGSRPAAQLFFTRGESQSPTWSPDGTTLAFVSDRGDHSFIGLFTVADQPIRYLAPSTSQDSSPRWSSDGRRIAFVRRPGRGAAIESPLERHPAPWAIWVGETGNLQARAVWKSPETLWGSFPQTAGQANLQWGANDRLVFLADLDGWPHLYSVPPGGGDPLLLTPGKFMVEYVAMTPDRRAIVYNANTGTEAHDVDRRHLFKVAVDAAQPLALTSGKSLDYAPVVTGDGASVAYIGGDAQNPPMPMVVSMGGGMARGVATDRLPADFPAAQLVTPEPVVVRASDGVDVHCQLFKTAGSDAKKPAIVFVHGGPPRQMLLGWHYMFYYANGYAVNQYLASRGYVVLSVNYRLGIGYGHDFHHPEHAGARGAAEYQDVLAAGRYLQGRPDVDASRIGIWGGSYGGYLTAMALARNSDVFAAGVDIHGVHDWTVSEYRMLVDSPLRSGLTEADRKQVEKVAWESSPNSSIATWRSPVLLIHADDDRNVPFQQTVDLARRLSAAKVSFDEIVIPDDIHDFLLYRSWLTVDSATASYFDKVFKKVGTGSGKH